MLLDKTLFRLGREFGAHWRTVRDEVARLPPDAFVDWIDTKAYSGGWKVFLLLVDHVPTGYSFDPEPNRRALPRTWDLVRSQPQVITAAVSRLLPGCRIHPHVDTVQPRTFRYHLCLDMDAGSGLSGPAWNVACEPGHDYVFDHRDRHASQNDTTRPRDVLLLDFVADAAELARLEPWRRARALVGSESCAGDQSR